MARFAIPDAAEFARWDRSSLPGAVVRLLCNNGHVITEWWRTCTGDEHPWGGYAPELPDEKPIVKYHDVGGPFSPAQNPESPGVLYFRLTLTCREMGCIYRRVLTPEGQACVTHLLDALVAGDVPSGQQFAHPSGAAAIAVPADNLFGYRRVAGTL